MQPNMRKLLTDRACRSGFPAPPGKRVLVYDSQQPRLALQVTDTGARSFILYTRIAGRPVRRFIGKAGVMLVADARQRAGAWLAHIAAGRDPAEVERARIAAATPKAVHRFADVAEAFIQRHVAGQRSAREIAANVRAHLVSRWCRRPIEEIGVDDVVALSEAFRKAGHIGAGQKTFAQGRALFRWAIHSRAYDIDRSPFEGLSPAVLIGTLAPRDRVLGEAEIRALWRHADAAGEPDGAFLKLLLLTGARRDEVADMSWPELDMVGRLWTVPAGRFKGKRDHIVPLSSDALALLEAMPKRNAGPYLLTTTAGARPIAGFSKIKRRADTAVKASTPWTLHDVRRTMRSGLSALGVPPAVAELCIGHRLPGLLGVYDRHEALAERRDAFEKWSARLREITS